MIALRKGMGVDRKSSLVRRSEQVDEETDGGAVMQMVRIMQKPETDSSERLKRMEEQIEKVVSNQQTPRSTNVGCYQCGEPSHFDRECPHRNVQNSNPRPFFPCRNLPRPFSPGRGNFQSYGATQYGAGYGSQARNNLQTFGYNSPGRGNYMRNDYNRQGNDYNR